MGYVINNNLEQQAEAIFQSILSNAITTVNLGEIADVKGGKRLPKGVNLIDIPNAHPYIRVRDLNNALFASLTPNYAYVDKETQKSISRYIVSTGDVLISIVGTIGLTAIVDSTLDKANPVSYTHLATTRDLTETARQAHNTSPVATAALGRLMTAAVMMGYDMKGEDDLSLIHI